MFGIGFLSFSMRDICNCNSICICVIVLVEPLWVNSKLMEILCGLIVFDLLFLLGFYSYVVLNYFGRLLCFVF